MELLLTDAEILIFTEALEIGVKNKEITASYYETLKHFGLRKKAITKRLDPLCYPYSNIDAAYRPRDTIFHLINEGIKEHSDKYPQFKIPQLNKGDSLSLLKSMYNISIKNRSKIRIKNRLKVHQQKYTKKPKPTLEKTDLTLIKSLIKRYEKIRENKINKYIIPIEIKLEELRNELEQKTTLKD